MLADLDLLLIAVFCAADDLLPKKSANAKRIETDAEVVTLCVAQAIMGIPSDRRFLAVARHRLRQRLEYARTVVLNVDRLREMPISAIASA